MTEFAQDIREAIREELKKPLIELRGHYYDHAKPFLTAQQKHDRKKKFLNYEEACWWRDENQNTSKAIQRPYSCHMCPFWHLTTLGQKEYDSL